MTEPPLTPATIAALRASLHSRSSDGTSDTLGFPFIVWGQSGQEFYLHAYGRTVARSTDIVPLAACMVAERSEPGFIKRILDPSLTCDEAALALPQLQSRLASREASAHAREAAREVEAEAARVRDRMKYVPASELTLDDFL